MRAERARALGLWATPVAVFVASRVVVWLGILFSGLLPHNPGLPADPPGALSQLMHWDAAWYRSIAAGGYVWARDDPNANVIFFPLYPLVSRVLQTLTGLSLTASMILVSNSAFLAALVWLHRYLVRVFDRETALWSILFLAFFPTSLFFSTGYPEALCLLLSVGTFACLEQDRPLAASAMAGLATATRSPMVILVLPILWHLVVKLRAAPRYLAYAAVCLLTSVGGLLAYMLYLWLRFGDPFVFVTGYEAWKAFNPVVAGPLDLLTLAAVARDLRANLYTFTARTFDAIFLTLSLAAATWGLYRHRRPLFAYAWVLVLFSYFSHAHFSLVSMTRYLVLAFPVFIVAAEVLGAAAARAPVLALLSALLFMHSALFAKWYWAG
ncbi:MAG: hypothetical protein HY727_05090 [Candidatus Rokubacteria bacterium]|nr:hypothetical protein [Candidatus Rokubacteria bacterium]